MPHAWRMGLGRRELAALTLGLLLLLVVARGAEATRKHRYCGEELITQLQAACTMRASDGTDVVCLKKFSPLGNSQPAQMKDVVDACCRHKCTKAFMKSFCCSDSDEFSRR